MDKLSQVLHDEAVTIEKLQQKPSKKIRFLQPACGRQSSRHSDLQSSKSSTEKGSFSGGRNFSSSSIRQDKGKKF